jgi:glutamate-1-semialdehyde 2,1-aminomutase
MSSSPQSINEDLLRESVSAHERRQAVIPGGVNSNVRLRGFPTPLTYSRALGSHIWDVDGNEYVDYAMGMGPHILGHAPRVVVDAVRQSLDRGQLFAGQCDEELELAQLISGAAPWIEQLRIGSSGTEMALLAVRVARAATGRQKVVRFVGHYHGWLDPLFVDPARHDAAQPPLTPGQSVSAADDVLLCPWNDLNALDQLLSEHHDSIAALLMEPIMCNTGLIEPLPGYLEKVAALCRRYEIVFVVDEVITGFRVALGGAQERYGVHGDLTVYAKAIAAGYPVAVLGGRADLLAAVGTGQINHSGTYNTGVVQMAAAVATVRELRDSDPYPAIGARTQELASAVRDAISAASVDLHVTAVDGLLQLRFGPDAEITNGSSFSTATDPVRLGLLLQELQREGVRSTSRGLFFISAAHSAQDVELTAAAFGRALTRLEPGPA